MEILQELTSAEGITMVELNNECFQPGTSSNFPGSFGNIPISGNDSEENLGASSNGSKSIEDIAKNERSSLETQSICLSSRKSPNDIELPLEEDALLQEEIERLATVSVSGSDSQDCEAAVKVLNKEEQYTKLVELLTKSQFYTQFLLKKIEADRDDSKTRKRKTVKRSCEQNTVNVGETQSDNSKQGRLQTHRQNVKQVINIAADVIASKKIKLEDVDQDEAEHSIPSPSKSSGNDQAVEVDQPKLLTGASLRDYQREGLEWLKVLFENGVNGILADEMGLGKTIQVIALIAHLIEKNVRGPFLIIGPLSTLPNWMIEFERFTPDIPVVLYHGNKEARTPLLKKMREKTLVKGHKTYPVILTSYEYPMREAKVLRGFKWRYIIIDEGHRIKNHNSKLSRALRTFESANRLLMTGTPLQNSLTELWALLNFLLPEIFDNLSIFESWFNVLDLEGKDANRKVLEEEQEKQVVSTMHKILSPFMLRRVKADVKLDLPPKKELIVYAPMTPIQVDLYRAVLDFNIKRLKNQECDETALPAKRACTLIQKKYVFNDGDDFELLDDTEEKKSLMVQDSEHEKYAIRVKMTNTAMMMRKIVNHPYLVQYPLERDSHYCRIDEDLVTTSGKLQVLDAMLNKLRKRGHKVLLFSTFTTLLDIIEDYLSLRDFKYVRLDGSTDLQERQIFIKSFNSDPELFLFLISTRAGGLGINLAAADTVILYDSDWNPQTDLQAQDRCHRIGQTRPVVVYRFVTAGTVDERIAVRGAAKRKLEKMIIQQGKFNSLKNKVESSTLNLEELENLLMSRDYHRVVHPNGFDEELNELLDRSDMTNGLVLGPEQDGGVVEARGFKDCYGYTGELKLEMKSESLNTSVEIIDETSNDAEYPKDPVRKSSVHKAGMPMDQNCTSVQVELKMFSRSKPIVLFGWMPKEWMPKEVEAIKAPALSVAGQ